MQAGGHIRDQFIEAIEGNEFPPKEILGKLWNCTDIMPYDVRSVVADISAFPRTFDSRPEPTTYAQGARRISEKLKWDAAAVGQV